MSTADDIILSSTQSSKKHYVKNIWSNQEDFILNKAVSRVGAFNWNVIATLLSGRTAKQCRERWHNHLSVGIRKGEWSAADDKILLESQSELGNQWSKISKLLEGRSDTDTKNRFYVLKRAQKRSADHIDNDNSKVKSGSSYIQKFSDSLSSPIDSISRPSQSYYIGESNDGNSNNYHDIADEFIPIKSGSSKSLVSNDSYNEHRTQYFTYHDDEYIPPNSSSSKSLISTDSYKAECYGRTKHFTYHDDEYVPPQQQTGSTKSFHSAATPYTQDTQSYKRNKNIYFTNYYDDEHIPSQAMTGMGSTKSILSTESYKSEYYEGNKNVQNSNFKNYYNETVTSPDKFGSSKSLVSTNSYKAECYEHNNPYSPPLSSFTYIPSIQSESSKSFIKIDNQKNIPFIFDKPHNVVQPSSGSTKSILLTDSHYKLETSYDSNNNCPMGPIGSSKNVQFTFQNNIHGPSDNLPLSSSVSSKSLYATPSQPFNMDYYENTNIGTNHYMPPLAPLPRPLPQFSSQSIPVKLPMSPILPPNSLYRVEYYDKKAAMYQNNINVLRASSTSTAINSNDMHNTIQSNLLHSQTFNHETQQINNNNSQLHLITEHDVDFFAHFENQFIHETDNVNVGETGNKTADYSKSTHEQDTSLNYFSEDYEEILGYLASESAEMYDDRNKA